MTRFNWLLMLSFTRLLKGFREWLPTPSVRSLVEEDALQSTQEALQFPKLVMQWTAISPTLTRTP